MREISVIEGDLIKCEQALIQARKIVPIPSRPKHSMLYRARKTVRIEIERAFWRKERPL